MRKMYNFKDLVGQRFIRLLVIKQAPSDKWGSAMWVCKCDCGNIIIALGSRLRRGGSKSCGCYHRSVKTTHGASKTREYGVWAGMRTRCYKKTNKAYKDYGGRGIKVCDRWVNSFSNFMADMGPRPKGMTVERINNDGNYEPSNCKWATMAEQNRNKRNTKHGATDK